MVAIYIRPDADTVDGTWVNESASATNLYASIDESTFSDTDYIRSGDNPVGDVVKLRLSNFASAIVEPMKVRYRLKKNGPEPLNLIVRLVQGNSPGTVIAEWTEEDVSTTYSTEEQTLTTGQFSSITDLTDLYLEFEATTNIPTALDLLTGETQGFSIDARSVVTAEAAYIGGPYGGTVAVIDTGTPANNLSDVALDASNLVNSGTSPKMVHNVASPYVRWSAHNFVINSQTIPTSTGSGWGVTGLTVTVDASTAPNGTATAEEFKPGGGAATFHGVFSDAVTTVANAVYCGSVYVKKGNYAFVGVALMSNGTGTAWIRASVDLDSGTVTQTDNGAGGTLVNSGITSVGSGWFQIWVAGSIGSSTDMDLQIQINEDATPAAASFGENQWSAAGTETVNVWGAQLNRGIIPTPYLVTTSAARIGIPQSYDATAAKYGILIEPAATNLLPHSSPATYASWTLALRGTGAANVTGPDGQANSGTTWTASSTDANGTSLKQTVTTTSGQAYTLSIYVKAGSTQWVYLYIQNTAGTTYVTKWFDVTNGVVGSTDNATWTVGDASITNIGDGWYRCTLTVTVNVTTTDFFFGFCCPSDFSYACTSGDTMLAYGGQAELGTVATSLIPTTGATATRAMDLLGAAVSTYAHSATLGTMYVDLVRRYAVADAPSSFPVPWLLRNSGDADIGIEVYLDKAAADETFFISDAAGATQVDLDLDTSASGANVRVQLSTAWEANNFAGSADGQAVVTDVSGTVPIVTNLSVGSESAGNQISGFIYRLVYVPRRVIDGDLPTWRFDYP